MRYVVVGLLLVVVFSGVSTSRAANILPNPGFENWFDTLSIQMPVGWLTTAPLDPNSAYRSTRAHSGSYSLALGTTSGYQGVATTAVMVVGGTHYDFSFYYNIPSWVGIAMVILAEVDSGDSIVAQHLQLLSNTFAWSQFTLGFDAHPAAVIFDVVFTSLVDTVFIDDGNLDGQSGTGVDEWVRRSSPSVTPILLISPNPCIGGVRIVATAGKDEYARVSIYDVSGRPVKKFDGWQGTGATIDWDGLDENNMPVSAGTYYVRLTAGSGTVCERITLLR